ncbi:MAG: hypothetical protein CUN55_00555 [Phototrophicales bacterium]|nr:MAG: hypothetical protein CUN55_00555 [Phototrophicales bacterium]
MSIRIQNHIHIYDIITGNDSIIFRWSVSKFERQKHYLTSSNRGLAGKFYTHPQTKNPFVRFEMEILLKDGTGDPFKPDPDPYQQYLWLSDRSVEGGYPNDMYFVPIYHEDDGEDHMPSLWKTRIIEIGGPKMLNPQFDVAILPLVIEGEPFNGWT